MACNCSTKITLAGNATVGDSILNVFNANWLLAANKYHDWQCVETSDGVNFDIHTNIEVGDGVTPTFFKDVGKNFRFDAGKDFILNAPAYLEVTGVWTQAEKDLLLNKVDDIHKVGGLDSTDPVAMSGDGVTETRLLVGDIDLTITPTAKTRT